MQMVPGDSKAIWQASPSGLQPGSGMFAGSQAEAKLQPGTYLHNSRYRLLSSLSTQIWLYNSYETNWLAQGINTHVFITEVMLPESNRDTLQSLTRQMARMLSLAGTLTGAARLIDAFSEYGRTFFVFHAPAGETLASQIQSKRHLSEQEVLEGCLQVAEQLQKLESHSLIHGRISPHTIIVEQQSRQWHLLHFSAFLAGRAHRYLSPMPPEQLPPYAMPEGTLLDPRADLYALLATAYHALTGLAPERGHLISPRKLNQTLSVPLNDLLMQGLHPDINRRYQSATALVRDLNYLLNHEDEPAIDPMAQMFAEFAEEDEYESRAKLIPRPEDLPPISSGNDLLLASCWLAGITACLTLLTLWK